MRELETDIEPFKGLLLGLFFIAVGMSIDFGVLRESPGLMAAILLGFLGLKVVVIYGLATLMKLPYQERPVFVLLLAQGGEFAFVVFQAAAGARVFSPETASLLIGAVALSMLISPLLLVAVDKLLLPRYARNARDASGRKARLLLAQGIAPTVLDHDADMVESLRSFGYRVFYGDATRLDLLRTAGAASAQILVVAVDDVEQSLTIVDLAKEHFPQLQIVARAGCAALERAARPGCDLCRARAVRVQPAQRQKRAGAAGPAAARSPPGRHAFSPAQPGAVRAHVPAPQRPQQSDRRGPAGPTAAGGTDGAGTRTGRTTPTGWLAPRV